MIAVTKYEATDGTIYDTAIGAARRDVVVASANVCNSILPSVAARDSNRFCNSGDHIQHSPENIAAFTRMLGEVIALEHGQETAERFTKNPRGIVGRILGDAPGSVSYSLYYRLSCIDPQSSREYGQPFFALYPDQASAVEITATEMKGLK